MNNMSNRKFSQFTYERIHALRDVGGKYIVPSTFKLIPYLITYSCIIL